MMRLILSLVVFGFIGSNAVAASSETDSQLYVRSGDTFKPVSKRDATVAFLKDESAPVYKCVEQRLTSKLTLKARSSD